jgi:hypothetical protein
MNYSEMNFDSGATALTWKDENFHYYKMNRLTDIYLGTTHSQIVYDPLGHKTNMLWENITHISEIANPHAHHQRIANPLERVSCGKYSKNGKLIIVR